MAAPFVVNPEQAPAEPYKPKRTMREAQLYYHRMLAGAIAEGGEERLRMVRRGLGLTDLFFLLTELMGRHFMRREWIYERCCEVQERPDNCLDLWFRDGFKSTIISFGKTIQDILRDPEVTVGIFSHTRGIARGFLDQIMRELKDNELLKKTYSDVLWEDPERQAPKWSLNDGIIVKRHGNPKEATVEAWGVVDGQPTSRHFKIRVYDDMVTLESVSTPEQIRRTIQAWELSDNLGMAGGVARYIGTRYKLQDPYAEMIERGVVHVRRYPATDNGRLNGKPVLLTQEEWDFKKRSQRSTIAAQMLQNPTSGEDQTFDVGWLMGYELRPLKLRVAILVDASKGRSRNSDRTAIAVVGVGTGGAKYLLDGYCHRMGLTERWQKVRDLWRAWHRQPGIEMHAVGVEIYGLQTDDEYFRERMQIEKVFFPLKELNWVREGKQSKNDRIERLEADFRPGRFYLPLPVYREGIPGQAQWRLIVDKVVEANHAGEEVEIEVCNGYDFFPLQGLTASQREALRRGERALLAKAIKRVDENGEVYDVTVRFLQEYSDHPYAPHDDFIDAVSRIYDMEMTAPPQASAAYIPPPDHWDV